MQVVLILEHGCAGRLPEECWSGSYVQLADAVREAHTLYGWFPGAAQEVDCGKDVCMAWQVQTALQRLRVPAQIE